MKGKWGFIDKKGKLKVHYTYDYVEDFSGGLAQVYLPANSEDEEDRLGYVDANGTVVWKPAN